jgi:hypothetical protein
VIAWKIRYAPPTITAHIRFPFGIVAGPKAKMYQPSVTRLIANVA